MNIEEAYDDIINTFYTYWMDNTPAIAVTAPKIDYGVEEFTPVLGEPWARIIVSNGVRTQTTMSNTGSRSFNQSGTVLVQVMTPINISGPKLNQQLSDIAINAFEGKETLSGIWFEDISVRNLGHVGSWYQTNILVNFSYFERK